MGASWQSSGCKCVGVPVQVVECGCVNVSVRTHIYIESVRTCLWCLPDGIDTAIVDEPKS